MRNEGSERLRNLPEGTQLTRGRPCTPNSWNGSLEAPVSMSLLTQRLEPPFRQAPPLSQQAPPLSRQAPPLSTAGPSQGAASWSSPTWGHAALTFWGLPSQICLVPAAFSTQAPSSDCFRTKADRSHG